MSGLSDFIVRSLDGVVSRELIVFIISMLPILELRGGLIVSSFLGIEMWKGIAICVTGNILPVPFILLLITPVFNWLKKTRYIRPLVEKLENRAMRKKDSIGKYQFLGLMLFVGIPLPGTGAWTGSLLAALLDIKFKRAFPAVILGILMATVIMTVVSYVIPGFFF